MKDLYDSWPEILQEKTEIQYEVSHCHLGLMFILLFQNFFHVSKRMKSCESMFCGACDNFRINHDSGDVSFISAEKKPERANKFDVLRYLKISARSVHLGRIGGAYR